MPLNQHSVNLHQSSERGRNCCNFLASRYFHKRNWSLWCGEQFIEWISMMWPTTCRSSTAVWKYYISLVILYSGTKHMKEQRSNPNILDQLGHPVKCDQPHEDTTEFKNARSTWSSRYVWPTTWRRRSNTAVRKCKVNCTAAKSTNNP